MAQSGRSSRQPGSDRHGSQRTHPGRSAGWAYFDESDADLPAWAGPPAHPVGRDQPARATAVRGEYEPADGWHSDERPSWRDDDRPPPGTPRVRRPPPGAPRVRRRVGRRAAAARLRRSRRRVYVWAGAAIVACVLAASITAIVTSRSPARPPYVTALLPGEFTSVPDACTAVSSVILNSYLPPSGRTAVATATGTQDSACSFTVDRKPDFLVLSVSMQAYQPFPAATGNGSASDNALDQFLADRQLKAHPPKKSPLPPASITPLAHLGTRAFQAITLEHIAHIATDVVTVEILDRNVIATVQLSGQESGDGFGPVPLATLEAGARTVAGSVLSQMAGQPTA